MSEILIEPLPTNPFTPYDRESRWVTLLAFLATLFFHLGVILVVPEELMPRNQGDTDEVQKEVKAYEISLVDPAEARFVEASPDQKDEDSLPAYPVLDGVLRLYVEEGLSRAEIIDKGYEQAVVDDIVRKVDLNEYKRKQAAPGLKTTPLAFGVGRRIPIVQKYVS